ncbi:YaiO family outer membrane beta-barrel protein [Aquisalimonas asiatica]|uniref:Outer membrane protein, YaiO family n=1 Tax=Aquisalimonas asiatica TaxID=406100 RepID=A0A1H8PRF1_9GAMM|nr:YaiO family outer membrane beta-barrel protein [Aquisalimonas asiatica]SEO44589.1 outer membrane protein, YaiO family [Aquisalimonas asiatica]
MVNGWPTGGALTAALAGAVLACSITATVAGTTLEELDAALEAAPDDQELRFDRARQRAWAGDYDGALADYDRLLADAPHEPDYLLGRAQVLLWSGAADEALPLLARAREAAPDYEAVWRVELQARAAADETDEAFLDAARDRFPDADWLPEPPRRAWEVEGSVRHDYLTRGADDWQEIRGDWLSYRRGGLTWSGHARQAWRFDDSDQELGLAVSRPLGPAWSGRVEGTVSPADGFLPDRSLGVSAGRPLPLGFGIDVGLRRSMYPAIDVDAGRVTTERYFGPWRAAYSAVLTRLQGGSSQLSHAASLTRYYQERSHAGVTLSAGTEDEYDAATGDVEPFTVRGAVVEGRHWFAPAWAVSWEAGYHEVDDAYERWGVRLGLRHSF